MAAADPIAVSVSMGSMLAPSAKFAPALSDVPLALSRLHTGFLLFMQTIADDASSAAMARTTLLWSPFCQLFLV